jgi:hypothetical protein
MIIVVDEGAEAFAPLALGCDDDLLLLSVSDSIDNGREQQGRALPAKAGGIELCRETEVYRPQCRACACQGRRRENA